MRRLLIILSVLLVFMAPIAVASDSDFKITILKDNGLPPFKRSVEVRLDRRLTKQQLESLAHKIKGLEKKEYGRTFILYYLPHQKPGAGAWASTHFTPALKVEILGATIDDVEAFRRFSVVDGWVPPDTGKKSLVWGETKTTTTRNRGGEIIGEWVWDLPEGSHKITVFKSGGKYMMNSYYRDGSQNTELLQQVRQTAKGLRFSLPDARYGEYYIVNKKGELECYDKDRGRVLTLPGEPSRKK